MKTSTTEECISSVGLIYSDDAKECYITTSSMFGFSMKWKIHLSSEVIRNVRVRASQYKFYVVFIIVILKETPKKDKINTNCPVATWIYRLMCLINEF